MMYLVRLGSVFTENKLTTYLSLAALFWLKTGEVLLFYILESFFEITPLLSPSGLVLVLVLPKVMIRPI